MTNERKVCTLVSVSSAICFSNMPLNKGGEGELTVNFLEYREADDEGDVKLRFSRVTDLEVTREQ